ncbi:MAG: dihydropteroate synthase, partial [Chitinispirillia bacterium]
MGNDRLNTPNGHPSMEILGKKPFIIMGIVNVTPDSFYDGGNYSTCDSALKHALKLINEGADILDIGGESSRPGARAISINKERERIIPLIKMLRNETDIPISIDTTKSVIAHEALLSGATWINDISAGRFDSDMALVAAEFQCPVILMHSRKRPIDMQNNPEYRNVVEEVIRELIDSVNLFLE